MTTLIEVSDLVVKAGSATILDRIELSVNAGEIIALVGPNGAGKSTLLRVLSGELRPSSGQVLFMGRPLGSFSPWNLSQHRAMLTQHTTVTFPFTVAEIVRMGAGQSRTNQWIEQALEDVAELCDIRHLRNQAVTSLSGGEQQRVHLARSLLQLQSSALDAKSRLLLLDEPTASLDLAHQLMVLDVVRAQAASGTTIIVVIHDLNLAAMLASRVVMMTRGKIFKSGTATEVISNNTIQAAFGVSNAVGIAPAEGSPFVLPHSMNHSI